MQFKEVVSAPSSIHRKYPGAIWITGGTIGLDSYPAEYARLRNVPLWLILPFSPNVMALKWNQTQISMLMIHIKYCAKLSVLAMVYKTSVYYDSGLMDVNYSVTENVPTPTGILLV